MIGCEKGQKADQAVIEAGPDRLALARVAALDQRCADAERALQTGDEIGDRWAGAQRRAVGGPGHAHEAAHRLGVEAERGPVALEAARAKAADVALDKVRLQRPDPPPVEA